MEFVPFCSDPLVLAKERRLAVDFMIWSCISRLHFMRLFWFPPFQAVEIKKRYDVCHLSTGDMLREEVKAGSELGAKLKDIMEAGNTLN